MSFRAFSGYKRTKKPSCRPLQTPHSAANGPKRSTYTVRTCPQKISASSPLAQAHGPFEVTAMRPNRSFWTHFSEARFPPDTRTHLPVLIHQLLPPSVLRPSPKILLVSPETDVVDWQVVAVLCHSLVYHFQTHLSLEQYLDIDLSENVT